MSEGGARILPETMRHAGAHVDVVHAYRNVPTGQATEDAIQRSITDRDVDIVTFTAPSTVESIARILGPDAPNLLQGITTASIGPITTAAAEKLGIRIDVSATTYTSDGLVDALRDHFAARERA